MTFAAQRFPKSRGCAAAIVLSVCLSACAYHSHGTIEEHYRAFATRPPENNTIFVCSAYGCRVQTRFKFTADDLDKLRSLMTEPSRADNPEVERRTVARTLAWMEKRVGDEVGTSADRPGDDLAGGGDPTQMDCVDVATNLTSYLLVLQRNNLLTHHSVGTVTVKEDMLHGWWPHYAATLIETQSKTSYAVDGWKLASGKEPEITEVAKWYVDDSTVLLSIPL